MKKAIKFATEKRSFEWCAQNYSRKKEDIHKTIERVREKIPLSLDDHILEIGSAQGLGLFALKQQGFRNVVGAEPSREVLKTISKLESFLKTKIKVVKTSAENLNCSDASLTLVIAISVLEHVKDDRKAFRNVFHALKKGGGFYFHTTSVICPFQNEVGLFPLFSWYPHKLKLKVISWCQKNRPDLIGHTLNPAINWYSPWKINRIARDIGFSEVYDRWDLSDNSGSFQSTAKKIIRRSKILRIIGNLIVPGSTYLFVK